MGTDSCMYSGICIPSRSAYKPPSDFNWGIAKRRASTANSSHAPHAFRICFVSPWQFFALSSLMPSPSILRLPIHSGLASCCEQERRLCAGDLVSTRRPVEYLLSAFSLFSLFSCLELKYLFSNTKSFGAKVEDSLAQQHIHKRILSTYCISTYSTHMHACTALHCRVRYSISRIFPAGWLAGWLQ